MTTGLAAYGRKLSGELITSVKKRAAIPQSQKTYQDEDILRFANEEMDNVLIPLILRTKEEFFVRTEEYTLTGGEDRIKIPYRAIGSKLRNLYIQSANGNTRKSLSRIQPEDVGEFKYGSYLGSKACFYLEGDDIVLVSPTGVVSGDKLMISYYLRPNDIVSEDRVPQITIIEEDTINNIANLYLTSLPEQFEIGEYIDLIEDERNHRTIDYDIAIVDVNDDVGGTVRVTISLDDLPEDLAVGDHVALAGESKVPQIPGDLHGLLAQATACRILEAQSDPMLDRAEKTLTKMLDSASTIIDTRTEGNPQKVLQTGGFLKRKRYIE